MGSIFDGDGGGAISKGSESCTFVAAPYVGAAASVGVAAKGQRERSACQLSSRCPLVPDLDGLGRCCRQHQEQQCWYQFSLNGSNNIFPEESFESTKNVRLKFYGWRGNPSLPGSCALEKPLRAQPQHKIPSRRDWHKFREWGSRPRSVEPTRDQTAAPAGLWARQTA